MKRIYLGALTLFVFNFCPSPSFSQSSGKRIIFDKVDTIENWDVENKYERFSPSEKDIIIADSLAIECIKRSTNDYLTNEIKTLDSYYRQYVAFYDNRHRIIFMNCFCKKGGPDKRLLISASGGGSCYFQIKINLDSNTCHDFIVNALK